MGWEKGGERNWGAYGSDEGCWGDDCVWVGGYVEAADAVDHLA